MKRAALLILLCVIPSVCAIAYSMPPQVAVEAQAGPLDVSYFYGQLAPYGDWVEVPTYGWVWTPHGVASDWRPYSVGHWVYSDDDGWMWVGDEEWGWATYHYGRWYSDSGRWRWVPRPEWGPAWVSWRTGGGYIGWAPLPPQAVAAEVGLTIAAAALDALLPPRSYCFVEERHFTEERIYTHLVPPTRNVTIVNVTQNITNYTVVQSRYVNRGVPVENVEHVVGHAIPRARVVENTSASHRAVVEGNAVKVFRPQVRPGPVTVKPVDPHASIPKSAPDAERLKLEQKQAKERADLETRHTKEIQNPPKNVPVEQVKARHEEEHRALQQKQTRETEQHAAARQSSPPGKKH